MTVRVAEVARLFAHAGGSVIIALISLLHVDGARARAICGARFREIALDGVNLCKRDFPMHPSGISLSLVGNVLRRHSPPWAFNG